MARKGHLTRAVTKKECSWLEKDLKKGKVVYEFTDTTYGCIGPRGIAVSDRSDREPFYEVPEDAVKWEQ